MSLKRATSPRLRSSTLDRPSASRLVSAQSILSSDAAGLASRASRAADRAHERGAEEPGPHSHRFACRSRLINYAPFPVSDSRSRSRRPTNSSTGLRRLSRTLSIAHPRASRRQSRPRSNTERRLLDRNCGWTPAKSMEPSAQRTVKSVASSRRVTSKLDVFLPPTTTVLSVRVRRDSHRRSRLYTQSPIRSRSISFEREPRSRVRIVRYSRDRSRPRLVSTTFISKCTTEVFQRR